MKNVENTLLKILRTNLKLSKNEIFKLKNKKVNFSFNTHKNWDSLSHVLILNEIQKKFKIIIDEKNIQNFGNYFKILNYLKKKL